MPQLSPLLSQLRERAAALSPNQQLLARHVLANYQTVAFSTIKQLARACAVSEATIVRFSKAAGFAGYPALQKEIRRVVRADLKGPDRFKLTYSSSSSRQDTLSSVIRKEIENISYLQQTHVPHELAHAVSAVRGASEVLVAGTRSTVPLACHLWFGLSKIGISATRILEVTTTTYDRVDRAGRGALLVVIGFPRYLRELVELLRFARERGIKTLTITDGPTSPLRGELSLYAPAESASFVAFHCAPMILINTLLHELSVADRKKTLSALSRFEALAENKAYFHAPRQHSA